MSLIPFGEWLPDQPDFQNPGADNILNVIPRTPQSYGPFPSMAPALNALDARCQGAVGLRDSAGNSYNFAGTAAKLWRTTGSSWTDISGSTFSAAAEEQWRFVQFGDRLLALQINNNIQSFTLGVSSATTDLSAAAPRARYGCVAKQFLLLGNTVGGTADSSGPGSCPQRVWWPGLNDPTNFPVLGTTTAAAFQSDAQDITGDQGWITGLVGNVGPADALVFFEKAVHRAMYIGPPDIWGFYPASGVRGCPVPGSIQRTETGVIYLGPDDFYLYDGQSFQGIGNQKIAKTFYQDVDQTFIGRCASVLDPINKLYLIAYPSLATGNGVLDKILVCNYGLKSLTGSVGRWAPVHFGRGEFLFNATSFGYTVDNFTALTGFTVDSAPAGPDSRLWTGNKDIISMFDPAHTLNYFTGPNLAAQVETNETQIKEDRRSSVGGLRPIGDGGGSGTVVTPYIRNRIQDTPQARTASTMDAQGYCWFSDAEGFYHRYRINLAAGTDFSHLQGVDVFDDLVLETGV